MFSTRIHACSTLYIYAWTHVQNVHIKLYFLGSASENIQKVNDDLIIFTSENVGNGAFGSVFKGRYRNSPCAVKVLYHVAVQMHTK